MSRLYTTLPQLAGADDCLQQHSRSSCLCPSHSSSSKQLPSAGLAPLQGATTCSRSLSQIPGIRVALQAYRDYSAASVNSVSDTTATLSYAESEPEAWFSCGEAAAAATAAGGGGGGGTPTTPVTPGDSGDGGFMRLVPRACDEVTSPLRTVHLLLWWQCGTSPALHDMQLRGPRQLRCDRRLTMESVPFTAPLLVSARLGRASCCCCEASHRLGILACNPRSLHLFRHDRQPVHPVYASPTAPRCRPLACLSP